MSHFVPSTGIYVDYVYICIYVTGRFHSLVLLIIYTRAHLHERMFFFCFVALIFQDTFNIYVIITT